MEHSDRVEIETLVRSLVAAEARAVAHEEIVKHMTDLQDREAKTWKAISDLQAVVTRLETIASYQENRHKDVELSQKETEQAVHEMRVEQAKEAGKMGAIAGITSSVIVAVIIQLALAAFAP